MAIGDRIDEAVIKLLSIDLENALAQISISVDATGHRKWPHYGVNRRISEFVAEYEVLIYQFATAGCLKLGPQAKVTFSGKSLARVLQQSRNALLHEGDLSHSIEFTTDLVLGNPQGRVKISSHMLWGLVFSVVADPVNSTEHCKHDPVLNLRGIELQLNTLWGQLQRIEQLTGYTKVIA